MILEDDPRTRLYDCCMKRCHRCRRHTKSLAAACPFCGAPAGLFAPAPFVLALGLATGACVADKDGAESASETSESTATSDPTDDTTSTSNSST